jgi:hypothetical protein
VGDWRGHAVVLWPVESNVVFLSLDDCGGALLCLLYGEHFYCVLMAVCMLIITHRGVTRLGTT